MSGSSVSALPVYRRVSANESTQITAFEKSDPQTKADIAYFTKHAPTLKTPDALLKDYRSLSIVLEAFGMKGAIQQPALLRKLMTEDPTSKTSIAHRLANSTYLRFATAIGQFKAQPLTNQAGVDAVIKALGTQNFETAQDAQSPGMSDALYFKRSIQSVTSITQLMADPRLLKVAQAATNMPDQFGTLDYNFQVKLLSKQVTMKNFQNSAYVDKFVSRYIALMSASNSIAVDTTGALAILQGSGSSQNVLASLLPQSQAGNVTLALFA
jgi:hypothetical protein